MKDIARVANVHQTTVSLALNNDPRITVATKDKIQRIAKEMGYVPDPTLRSLVSYRRTTRKPRFQETLALIFDIKDTAFFEASDYLPVIKTSVCERAQSRATRLKCLSRGWIYEFSNAGSCLENSRYPRDFAWSHLRCYH